MGFIIFKKKGSICAPYQRTYEIKSGGSITNENYGNNLAIVFCILLIAMAFQFERAMRHEVAFGPCLEVNGEELCYGREHDLSVSEIATVSTRISCKDISAAMNRAYSEPYKPMYPDFIAMGATGDVGYGLISIALDRCDLDQQFGGNFINDVYIRIMLDSPRSAMDSLLEHEYHSIAKSLIYERWKNIQGSPEDIPFLRDAVRVLRFHKEYFFAQELEANIAEIQDTYKRELTTQKIAEAAFEVIMPDSPLDFIPQGKIAKLRKGRKIARILDGSGLSKRTRDKIIRRISVNRSGHYTDVPENVYRRGAHRYESCVAQRKDGCEEDLIEFLEKSR